MFKFVFCLLFLFSFASYAQETNNPFLRLPLIANYPLTEEFLLKLEKIEKECKNSLPEVENNSINYDSRFKSSIENYTAYLSSKPKIVSILKQNNLTAKDFAAGALTLIELSMLLVSVPEKEYSFEKNIIFLNNLEFIKKHFYRVTNLVSCEKFILKN